MKRAACRQSRFTIHPNLKMPVRPNLLFWAIAALFFALTAGFAAAQPSAKAQEAALLAGKAFISVVKPPQQVGGGYKLVYAVDAPIEVFWMNYPWYGGMTDFLTYTARWEQKTVLKIRSKYKKSVQ
jgi:hypothetical protein